jgi:cytochrome P450
VFRYDHVEEVLSSDDLYSIEVQTVVGPDDPLSQSMMFSDPPRHDFLREAANDFFRPAVLDAYESRIREETAERLDAAADRDTLDVMNDLGFPVAATTIGALLGVPEADYDRFVEYTSKALRAQTPDGEPVENPMAYRTKLLDYVSDLMADRRTDPRDDLVSHLLTAEVDGRTLADDDVVGFCEMLLVGGVVTNAVYSFQQVDGLVPKLADDRAALENAIEETLRYRSSTQALPRIAKADVELGGKQIREGDRLVAWIASANRDEAVFEDPDSFVHDRNPDDHLAFGTGTHFCLGSRIARMETRIVLSELLDRVEQLQVRQEDATVDMNPVILGFQSLPISFET